MFIPSDEKRHIYEALTRHNYFPNQKEGARELPPCFSTVSFTPEIAELLAALDETAASGRRKLGYDQVSYAVTRHNNVPRTLSLIHPKSYSLLVKQIHDNWENLKYITENDRSIIKPQKHIDGRMLVMNYEDITSKIEADLNSSFGKRFRVESDIANCFHSIYSHSIPWAIIGFDEAKENMTSGNKHWSDILDTFIRKTKRNETQGIAIGPGSSSVIAEIVLSAVDRKLESHRFEFKRYVDDYVCFCESHEEAQRFIQKLTKELNVYKLNINLLKTEITSLPEPTIDSWVTQLTSSFPVGFIDKTDNQRKLTKIEITHYFDTAVKLNKETPDGSVIKYAVSSILPYIESNTASFTLDYVINIAWHYPILIPLMERLLEYEDVNPNLYENQLNLLIIENAKNLRSDGMTWPLYFIKKYNLSINEESFSEILESKDCVAILLLHSISEADPRIIDFARKIISGTLYEKDQYWLLLYQLYVDHLIDEPYGDGVFQILKMNNVTFLPVEGYENLAHRYCDYINNPFVEESIKAFNEWTG